MLLFVFHIQIGRGTKRQPFSTSSTVGFGAGEVFVVGAVVWPVLSTQNVPAPLASTYSIPSPVYGDQTMPQDIARCPPPRGRGWCGEPLA